MFSEGRAGGKQRGEVLPPRKVEEVTFISHKSHVKWPRGEVIKQIYEARGKVHPFREMLLVSAALRQPPERGTLPATQKLPQESLIYSLLYLFDCIFLSNLLGFPLAKLEMGWKHNGWSDGWGPAINHQTGSFGWESCGKCSFGSICLGPTNNKRGCSPSLCLSPPFLPPSPFLAFCTQFR